MRPGSNTLSIGCGWLAGLIIFLLAVTPRLWNIRTINNYIDDASSRQVIGAFDALNGICHFPRLPYLFEYDDAGLSFVIIPFMWLLGTDWIFYQILAALSGAVFITVFFYFVSVFFGPVTAWAAAMMISYLPASLLWDRFVYNAGAGLMNSLSLAAILVLRNSRNRKPAFLVLSGIFWAMGSYFSSLMVLMLPVLVLSIFYSGSNSSSFAIRTRMKAIGIFCFTGAIASAPLWATVLYRPDYWDWRKRHFSLHAGLFDSISQRLVTAFDLLHEIFISVEVSQFTRIGYPLIPAGISLLIIPALLALRKKRWNQGWILIVFYPLLWLYLISALKAEPWREGYYIYLIPCLVVWAGLGMEQMIEWMGRKMLGRLVFTLAVIYLAGVCSVNAHAFFLGKHRFHMRNDNLTWLQLDLHGSRDIPHFFSAGINDVLHYHYPFWYVTRTNISRVSIVDMDRHGWFLMPDRLRIGFRPDSETQIAFVIRPQDEHGFQGLIDRTVIVDRRVLPRTGLLVITCSLIPDDTGSRTWNPSVIPPILPIVPG